MKFFQKITNLLNIKKTEKEPLDLNLPSMEELNDNSDAVDNEDDLEMAEIIRKIEKVRELAKVMGTTVDREEFYRSLIESQNILLELVKYEDKYDFDPPPSKDLECLEKRKKEQMDFLEYRIKEADKNKEEKSSPDLDAEVSDVSEPESIISEKENEIAEEKSSGKAVEKENIIDAVFKEILDAPETEEASDDIVIEKAKDNSIEMTDEINEMSDVQTKEANQEKKTFKYLFPPIDLLNQNQESNNYREEIEQRAEKLIQIFRMFNVNAEIVDIVYSPRFTRFEIQIGYGVRIKDVLKIKDDIKLNLEASNLHIEAPIPGKTTIGLDVENKKLSVVTFREMLGSWEFIESPSSSAIAVGRDVSGNAIVDSLENMCHLLIGGTTGSGKSVCISSIMMSILYKAHPDEVKLILIDTKAINLSMYNGIPHLLIPVVTDLSKAAAALHWCVAEMTDRYRKFSYYGVRDLQGYNKAVEKHFSDDEALQKMPSIVIIIDDFSDLMIGYKNEVEESICRLAQMGRACGIHLIISTQRPSTDVITGTIKANIPSRIAFNVFSAIESRTILDTKGAENLLGDGDMLFCTLGQRTPLRVQGTFVSDEEITNVIDFVKNQTVGNAYRDDVEKKVDKIQNPYSYSSGTSEHSGIDELFEKAGRFVIEHDKASIGMLQRYLKIGFNRAARIMDQLAESGVVGEEEGTKPRRILMSVEQFEKCIEELN